MPARALRAEFMTVEQRALRVSVLDRAGPIVEIVAPRTVGGICHLSAPEAGRLAQFIAWAIPRMQVWIEHREMAITCVNCGDTVEDGEVRSSPAGPMCRTCYTEAPGEYAEEPR